MQQVRRREPQYITKTDKDVSLFVFVAIFATPTTTARVPLLLLLLYSYFLSGFRFALVNAVAYKNITRGAKTSICGIFT